MPTLIVSTRAKLNAYALHHALVEAQHEATEPARTRSGVWGLTTNAPESFIVEQSREMECTFYWIANTES